MFIGDNTMADTIMWSRSKQVNTNLVVKLNGGSTEGTNLFTYNGSGTKTVNITPSGIGAAASSHNHSAANITSGTLGVARGGTGITSNPSMLVNLASTSTASVFAASPRPGVTGTLPLARGGTGATTAANARTNLGAASSNDVAVVASTITYDSNWVTGFTSSCYRAGKVGIVSICCSLGIEGADSWLDLGLATIGLTSAAWVNAPLCAQASTIFIDCFIEANSNRIYVNARGNYAPAGSTVRGMLVFPIK